MIFPGLAKLFTRDEFVAKMSVAKTVLAKLSGHRAKHNPWKYITSNLA